MKLYVKQKPLSLTEKFTVINSKEEDRYIVEGTSVSFGRKLFILDMDRKEVASVKQKFMSLQPRFMVYHDGNIVIEVMQKFAVAKHKYAIEGSGWTVSGDIGSHDYTISCSFGKIAVVSIVQFAGHDCLELDLSNTVNEANIIRALATVLAIDCVVAKRLRKEHRKEKTENIEPDETEFPQETEDIENTKKMTVARGSEDNPDNLEIKDIKAKIRRT